MALTYDRYIQSKAWERRRWLYFAGHERRCRLCGGLEKIHLHHRTYERMGAELDSDLVPLCEGCHSLVHQLQRDRGCTVEEATDRALGALVGLSAPRRVRHRPERRKPKSPPVAWPKRSVPPVGRGRDPMAIFFNRQRQRQKRSIAAEQVKTPLPETPRKRRDREAARLRAVYQFQMTGARSE